jgi:predicted negative regulator of RcsB-dependent stress response
MNQKNVVIIGTVLILSVGGYFALKYYQRMKIDQSVVPIDEALAMLEKAKES